MMARRISILVTVILIIFMERPMSAKEYESPKYTQYVAEVTSTFTKEMYKKYGLECGASGGEMPYDVEEISVQLVAYHSANIEEARELEVKVAERFVEIINAHEKIRPYLREYPFPSGRARVSIAFENPKKKKTQSTDNDVELVLHAKNRIFYQAYDPNNPYVGKDIKDEPYDEALKIVQSNATKSITKKP
jgi:hypothetical protein